jgi:hypothetical protein
LGVLVRRLIAPLSVLVMVLAGCGGSSDGDGTTSTAAATSGPTREIEGSWAGKLTQTGISPFRIAVVISADGTGLVAYTGIECGGHWKLNSSAAPQYVFTESIDAGAGGKCKGSGTVHLVHTASGTLQYRFAGGGVTSTGSLAPASARALTAIFDQAGIGLP